MGRRRQGAPAPLEKAIQAAVLDHWRLLGVPGSLVAAIPNQFAHGQPGLTPGLPDLLVLSPLLGRFTGYIELKRERRSHLSDAQKDLRGFLLKRGVPYAVCHGRDEPIKVLEEWGARAEGRGMNDAVAIREVPETPTIAYERGRNEILVAVKVDDVKKIRDQAAALKHYWRQRKDQEMVNAMKAIALRADVEIGVRSDALKTATGNQYASPTDAEKQKAAVLKKAGISTQVASSCERLAAIVKPRELDRKIQESLKGKTPVPTANAILKQHKDDQAKAAFHQVRARIPSNLHVGDFRDTARIIPDGSVDLVFTDPPYDRESISFSTKLPPKKPHVFSSRAAASVSYCGHLIVADVLPLMRAHVDLFLDWRARSRRRPAVADPGIRRHRWVQAVVVVRQGQARRQAIVGLRHRAGEARERLSSLAAGCRRRRAFHRGLDR